MKIRAIAGLVSFVYLPWRVRGGPVGSSRVLESLVVSALCLVLHASRLTEVLGACDEVRQSRADDDDDDDDETSIVASRPYHSNHLDMLWVFGIEQTPDVQAVRVSWSFGPWRRRGAGAALLKPEASR